MVGYGGSPPVLAAVESDGPRVDAGNRFAIAVGCRISGTDREAGLPEEGREVDLLQLPEGEDLG